MKYIGILVGIFLAVLLLGQVTDESNQLYWELRWQSHSPEQQKLIDVLLLARKEYEDQEYQSALLQLHGIEKEFEKAQLDERLKFHFYHTKASVHQSLWHFVEAEQDWKKALNFAQNDAQRHAIVQSMQRAGTVIENDNPERNQHRQYLASPGIGPAGKLQGKVALIYVFIEDKNSDSWSLRQRQFVQYSLARSMQWIQSKVQHYRAVVEFSPRYFIVDRDPVIKHSSVGDVKQHYSNAQEVAARAAQHLGFPSVDVMIQTIIKQEQADQGMLLLHIARNGRSFARRCLQTCDENSEYVFVMEAPRSKKWQSMEYVQTHEGMHLFGADDLYNIDTARLYASRDIMNYPSRELSGSTMEDITAYAVGLIERQPATPFKITVK